MLGRFEWCVRHRRPYLVISPVAWSKGREHKSYVVLTMPFGERGEMTRLLQISRFTV